MTGVVKSKFGLAISISGGGVVKDFVETGSKQDDPQPLVQHLKSLKQSASEVHSFSHVVLFNTIGHVPGFSAIENRNI